MSAGTDLIAEMLVRLDDLENRELGVDDLPLAALQRRLLNNWTPDAKELLQKGSILPDNMGPGLVAAATKANQAIANNVFWVKAGLDTAVIARGDGMIDLAGNQLKAPRAGWFFMTGWASFAGAAAGIRGARCFIGATVGGQLLVPTTGAALTTDVSITGLVPANANDAIVMELYQNSGAPLNCNTRFGAVWLGPLS